MDHKLMKQLLDAGVSAETLLRVMFAEDEPVPEPVKPEPAPEPAPEPEPTPAPEPAPAEPASVRKETEDVVLAAIRELTGAIQASNIINNGREKQDLSIADQADAVLTKILTGEP